MSHSHQRSATLELKGLRKIALVGSPNVGKSVIFNNLTGLYATISNYPGTTVEVSRGKTKIEGEEFEVIDTPGMYSLLSITDDERVARLLLLKEKPAVVLHIVDAKNLERMLPQTLQLMETGLRIILVLNIMDEAVNMGIKIDVKQLENQLGIPVVVTVATEGQGMADLKYRVENYV
ncbi:MAG: FeoB small GTPase domain-containing protein [Candidatus Heimdallarchaeota archaeon]